MTDARLLFLGRTGVGKSSLINFFAGEKKCETNPYRACTKEPEVISVSYGENKYELIDSPGLCESGDEIDSLYLELTDKFLLDEKVSPNLVFKCDDTRLRTEDYKLLSTLLRRYGNRILQNGGLMLTFASNLNEEYDAKISKRVKLITSAIYGIEVSLGIELFPGFPRITLVDSESRNIFKINDPNNGIVMDDILNAVYQGSQYELANKLGVHPEMSESILSKILADQRRDGVELGEILSRLNRFPFHNIINNEAFKSSRPSSVAPMSTEPKSVYELAQKLSSDGFEESSIVIEGGLLVYKATFSYRKVTSSEKYADCISVIAFAARDSDGLLQYTVHYKIVNHAYKEDGTPDVTQILALSEDSASTIVINASAYMKFRRLIGHPSFLVNTGLNAMRQSMEESLSNETIWQ